MSKKKGFKGLHFMAHTTIAIGSGPGGRGKTVIATNLACELAYRGYNVVCAELDLSTPRQPDYFDGDYMQFKYREREGKTLGRYLLEPRNQKTIQLEETLVTPKVIPDGKLRIAMPTPKEALSTGLGELSSEAYNDYIAGLEKLPCVDFLLLDLAATRTLSSVIMPASRSDVLIAVIGYANRQRVKSYLSFVNQTLAFAEDADLTRKRFDLMDNILGVSTPLRTVPGLASMLRLFPQENQGIREMFSVLSHGYGVDDLRRILEHCEDLVDAHKTEPEFKFRELEQQYRLLEGILDSPSLSVCPVVNTVPLRRIRAVAHTRRILDEFIAKSEDYKTRGEEGVIVPSRDGNILPNTDLVRDSTERGRPLVVQRREEPTGRIHAFKLRTNRFIPRIGYLADAMEKFNEVDKDE